MKGITICRRSFKFGFVHRVVYEKRKKNLTLSTI